jgi:hypothetical protein
MSTTRCFGDGDGDEHKLVPLAGDLALARISHTRERWAFDLRRSTVYIHGWLDRITERQRAAALDHRDHVGGVVWRQGGCALSGSC